VVIAIIAILAALLLSRSRPPKTKAQGIICREQQQNSAARLASLCRRLQ